MKKIILFTLVSLFSVIITSCDKKSLESENNGGKTGINNQRTGGYLPGEVFYEDGWTGWIDPALTSEPVPLPNKEEAKWKGSVVKEGGVTYISCPSNGDNCGRLYIVDENGVTYVGLYLEDN